jgi:hypothetical protein
MNADANRAGFRILRKEQTLLPMELLWRWSFGLGLLGLSFFAYAHLRQAVLLSDADELALGSQDPFVVANAVAGLVAGILPLLIKTLSEICSVAAVSWIACAALGRGVITRMIVRGLSAEHALTIAPDAPRWAAFAALSFGRVLMLLIVVIGYLGGVGIAGIVSAPEQNNVASALIFFASLAASSVVWSYVNWVLSLAPIFVVRDALSPIDSVVEAIAFIRRNYSRLSDIALWNSTLRAVVATVVTLTGVATVGLRLAMAPWVVTALLALQTLVYLVFSDLFLLARLASYASVAVRELTLKQTLAVPQQSSLDQSSLHER